MKRFEELERLTVQAVTGFQKAGSHLARAFTQLRNRFQEYFNLPAIAAILLTPRIGRVSDPDTVRPGT